MVNGHINASIPTPLPHPRAVRDYLKQIPSGVRLWQEIATAKAFGLGDRVGGAESTHGDYG